MATQARETLATRVDSEVLSAMRAIAQQEGRLLQVLIEEALSDLVEKRKRARPRATVMAAYQASHEIFAPLYKKLAE